MKKLNTNLNVMILMLSAVLSSFLLVPPALAGTLKFGDSAPLISFPDPTGRAVALHNFVGPRQREKGSGAILVFFTTWCPVSKKELPGSLP